MTTTAEFELKAYATAQSWINDSVRENRIVHQPAASYEEEAYLLSECKGWSESTEVVEYWGRTETGGNWRVHIDAR